MNDFLLKMMLVISNGLGYLPGIGGNDQNSQMANTSNDFGGGTTSGGTSGSTSTGEKTVKTLSDVAKTMVTVIKKILGPVLAVIGVAAVIYAIILGVNYAKAEDADARKKVQGRLIGALIGAAIIIVGATLCFALDWANIFKNFSGVSVG